MSKDVRLSDQQFQVVQAVNKLSGASAREVQRELAHLELAHTTIATVTTPPNLPGRLLALYFLASLTTSRSA